MTENQEVVVITRRGSENVAMVSASELSSLMETAHLLRSPKNAKRLFTALNRVQSNKGLQSQTIEELRNELQLNEKK